MDPRRRPNGYLTDTEPWILAKDPDQSERLATVLATAAEGLRALAVLLNPVIPKATAKLWVSLGADTTIGPLEDQLLTRAHLWDQLPAGTRMTAHDVLFPRIEESEAASA